MCVRAFYRLAADSISSKGKQVKRVLQLALDADASQVLSRLFACHARAS